MDTLHETLRVLLESGLSTSVFTNSTVVDFVVTKELPSESLYDKVLSGSLGFYRVLPKKVHVFFVHEGKLFVVEFLKKTYAGVEVSDFSFFLHTSPTSLSSYVDYVKTLKDVSDSPQYSTQSVSHSDSVSFWNKVKSCLKFYSKSSNSKFFSFHGVEERVSSSALLKRSQGRNLYSLFTTYLLSNYLRHTNTRNVLSKQQLNKLLLQYSSVLPTGTERLSELKKSASSALKATTNLLNNVYYVAELLKLPLKSVCEKLGLPYSVYSKDEITYEGLVEGLRRRVVSSEHTKNYNKLSEYVELLKKVSDGVSDPQLLQSLVSLHEEHVEDVAKLYFNFELLAQYTTKLEKFFGLTSAQVKNLPGFNFTPQYHSQYNVDVINDCKRYVVQYYVEKVSKKVVTEVSKLRSVTVTGLLKKVEALYQNLIKSYAVPEPASVREYSVDPFVDTVTSKLRSVTLTKKQLSAVLNSTVKEVTSRYPYFEKVPQYKQRLVLLVNELYPKLKKSASVYTELRKLRWEQSPPFYWLSSTPPSELHPACLVQLNERGYVAKANSRERRYLMLLKELQKQNFVDADSVRYSDGKLVFKLKK